MKIAVCVTGASGAIYPRRILQLLGDRDDCEIHLVASANAPFVWEHELGEPMPDAFPGVRRWARHDFRAPFASGSNPFDAVIVAPCSMSTLARVAHGGGDDLTARACEVALKERRKLLLMVRETPLSLVHLRNMTAATEAGAVIMPAIPSFYADVRSLDRAVDSVVARVLDHAGVHTDLLPRWGAEDAEAHDE